MTIAEGVANDGNADDGPAGARDNVRGDVEDVSGGQGADLIIGDGDMNRLYGGPGADRLSGGADGDTLDGGDGPDTLSGGPGGDTADYGLRVGGVALSLDDQPNDGNANDGPPGARDNVGSDVEALVGGAGADTITGSPAANRIFPGAGADDVRGGGGVDTVTYGDHADGVAVTLDDQPDDGNGTDGPAGARDNIHRDVENLLGGSGPDQLAGTADANVLIGGDGDDVLTGGAGPDLLEGGAGTDIASYAERGTSVTADIDDSSDDGNSTDGPAGARDSILTDVEGITGGGGNDTLTAVVGMSGKVLGGGPGDDVLQTGQGPDRLDGGDGDDVLVSGLQNGDSEDVLHGGDGDDRLVGGGRADLLDGGPGSDTADYGYSTLGVVVLLDGAPTDGSPADACDSRFCSDGHRDNALVENVIGSSVGGDFLAGDDGPNVLTVLRGGNLSGLGGNDTLRARNGHSNGVDCGAGADDAAEVDAQDAVAGCEHVTVG